MWLRRLGLVAACGVVLLVPKFVLPDYSSLIFIFGFSLILPVVVFLQVLTFLHWKERYRGTHSTLWVVFLAIESSGWSKLVYLFRHIIPDMRRRGRYYASVDGHASAIINRQ